MTKSTHTAILFVHGIGNQTEYENLGGLLEALERAETASSGGALREFHPRVEPSRSGANADVPFMEFERFATRSKGQWRFRGRYRAYEVYWSPISTAGTRPLQTILWIAAQFVVPFKVRLSHWRQKYRIRLGRLHRACELAPHISVWPELAARFKQFQGAAGRRGGEAEASFAHFLSGLAARADLIEAAKRWRQTRLPCEISILRLAFLVPAVALSSALFAALLVAEIYNRIFGGGLQIADIRLWACVALLAPYPIVALPMLRFLTRTFAGVRFWTSIRKDDLYYDKRQAILAETTSMIRHILEHTECRRLVVVAHSLGTAIVYDALRDLGLRNMARADRPGEILRLFPLTDVITLGSPIDKIAYFFESSELKTYRAGRLREALRGDLATQPFYLEKPRIEWTNFYDLADPVSDPLYTPLGLRPEGGAFVGAAIRNIRVENTLLFRPVGSHVGYLRNPNVVDEIHHILFRSSRQSPQPEPYLLAFRIARPLSRVCGWAAIIFFALFCCMMIVGSTELVFFPLAAWAASLGGIVMAVLLVALSR